MSGRTQPTKGITVTQRGSRWYYRLGLEPDPLTGKRRRENKGGFKTEDAAWSAAMASKQRFCDCTARALQSQNSADVHG